MLGEFKSLFNNKFFFKSLGQEPINNQDFVIKHFTNDSRIEEDAHLYCFVGIKGENFDGNDFFMDSYKRGIRIFLLDKKPDEIPSDAIVYLVDDTLEAISLLAKHHKNELTIPHILITGSVGKTTTRLILTAILKEKYAVHTAKKNWNNAIGTPLTVLSTPRDTKISILEAGMNSKGEIAHLSKMINPEIAIITNVGYSHVGHLGGIDQVAEAKSEIVEGMHENSLLLINEDDPYRALFESKAKGPIVYFNPKNLEIIKDMGLEGFSFIHKDYPDFHFFCPIAGTHLLLNLSIIFALVDILQIPFSCIQKGLSNIQGLDDRMRIFTNKKGVCVIADCYNASLESFKAAIDVLKKAKGRKIAVIGSVLELGDDAEFIHKEIGKYINDSKIDLVLATGQEISHTCNQLTKIPYAHFEHKEDVWFVLDKELQENDTVLCKASNGIGLGLIVRLLEQ